MHGYDDDSQELFQQKQLLCHLPVYLHLNLDAPAGENPIHSS